jgi:hypothetical protein
MPLKGITFIFLVVNRVNVELVPGVSEALPVSIIRDFVT